MTEFWIWLSRTLGAGAKTGDIISYFGSPRELYEAGSREWRLSGIFTPRQIEQLKQFSPSESYSIYKACEENRWHIVTPSSAFYPTLLTELPDMPAVLFVDGDCSVLKSRVNIAFVGTRKATDYSKNVARILSKGVSLAGATVVSGGALGIDSAAHEGALESGGKTVAVLGCGFGTDYLQENEALRNDIRKSGALITEFLPFTRASRTTFPIRNRIISGMSLGTVVIEAGERSGSLITASLALSQGRNVFAVPGDLTSSAYMGTNALIRDGCIPVFSPTDILREYQFAYPELDLNKAKGFSLGGNTDKNEKTVPQTKKETASRKDDEIKEKPPVQRRTDVKLSPNAKKVYDVLSGEPMHIDVITEKSGIPSSQVLAAMTELELLGLVKLENGRNYKMI